MLLKVITMLHSTFNVKCVSWIPTTCRVWAAFIPSKCTPTFIKYSEELIARKIFRTNLLHIIQRCIGLSNFFEVISIAGRARNLWIDNCIENVESIFMQIHNTFYLWRRLISWICIAKIAYLVYEQTSNIAWDSIPMNELADSP